MGKIRRLIEVDEEKWRLFKRHCALKGVSMTKEIDVFLGGFKEVGDVKPN